MPEKFHFREVGPETLRALLQGASVIHTRKSASCQEALRFELSGLR